MKQSKSPFDTGNWSETTGLPHEQDCTNFLEHLTAQDPNKCFTRRQLFEAVASEFEIPTLAQETPGPGSECPQFLTGMSRVISNAMVGERHAKDNPFLKRLTCAVYQHKNGNGVMDPAMVEHLKRHRASDMVPTAPDPAAECLAFFKHGRKIGFTLGEMGDFAKGITKWDAELVKTSLQQAFA